MNTDAQPSVHDRREQLGLLGGSWLAPITGAVSRLRRARMFHPEGVVYAATLRPTADAPELAAMGGRLAGAVLVRFSSAWWRGGKEWPDVLGMALRFRGSSSGAMDRPDPLDQDLLLATIRFPWTTLLAPLATDVSSFLWNHYHGVSPFLVDGLGRVKLRLRSPRLHNPGSQARALHLEGIAASGGAVYELQVRRLQRWPFARQWESVAELSIDAPLVVDQAALRFSPFRAGRGIHPVGFIHYLRSAAYAASQRARPLRSG